MSSSDRTRGCLLGGAVGDALGAPVEFISLRQIRDRYGPDGITDLDRSYGRVGAITDDTQMTLFTADGLLRWIAAGQGTPTGDARPHLYRAYLRWLDTQDADVPSHLYGERGWLHRVEALHEPRAPGTTCLDALRSGGMGTRDQPLNHSKGCGGVMRAAPAGLIGADDPFALGCDLAAITHSHPAGYLSAGFLAHLIHEVVAGHTLRDAVAGALRRLGSEAEAKETEAAVGRSLELVESGAPEPETVERIGGGWVGEEALAIAVFCSLVHENDFEAGVRLAVNHSGDTDSTGAITGNILGALLGLPAIPTRWLAHLELREEIDQVANDLAVQYRHEPDWVRRYPPANGGIPDMTSPHDADG
jgi:ADP-ribosylglycohydrolase